MTLTVYHLKTCDTCRKAIKALEAAGHSTKLIDVRADGVSMSELVKIESLVGWESLLNTRSTTWRGLSDIEKNGVDKDKALTLMCQHPTLIKRPVIMDQTHVTLGWTTPVQETWL